jgi:hypothetical protein
MMIVVQGSKWSLTFMQSEPQIKQLYLGFLDFFRSL